MPRQSTALAALLVLAFGQAIDDPYGKTKTCSSKSEKGDTCKLSWDAVHPTQYSIGHQEVRTKSARFSEYSSKELTAYLKDHPVPCIKWGELFFAIDHHHLLRSLGESTVDEDDKVVTVTVYDELEESNVDSFWEAMVKHNWVWLYDEKGYAPISPKLLPPRVGSLVNDQYRSLSYNVRKAGGYQKLSTPYQDFLWGEFFRRNQVLPVSPSGGGPPWDYCQASPSSLHCVGGTKAEDELLEKHLGQAMALARSEAAAQLPGYIKQSLGESSDVSESQKNPTANPHASNHWFVPALVVGAIALAILATVLVVRQARSASGARAAEEMSQAMVESQRENAEVIHEVDEAIL